MAKVAPYHSTHPSATRYHNNNACVDGNNIERHYLAAGTAGRPLCDRCRNLA